jgi:hypothetical protein
MLKARGNILRNHVRNRQGNDALGLLCGHITVLEVRA